MKGMILFSEIGVSLEKISLEFKDSSPCPGMEFPDIKEMLKQEFYEFEVWFL